MVGFFVLFLPFDLIKAGATQTETSLLKQYVAGERVDLLDEVSDCWPDFSLFEERVKQESLRNKRPVCPLSDLSEINSVLLFVNGKTKPETMLFTSGLLQTLATIYAKNIYVRRCFYHRTGD